MAKNALNEVILHLQRAALLCEGSGLTDAQLLECYVARRDEAVFEALVRRHGPMVLGVCRRILRNEADAEDAFQATFLVLVRKAGGIKCRSQLSNWLYGVAHNTALKARAMIHKRRIKEREAGTPPNRETAREVGQAEVMLDAELSQLPDKYRVPIVLCELEGKTIKEAARHLGWPQGTVATRLARGRALLAKRLSKHGLELAVGMLAAQLSQNAGSACVSTSLVSATVKAAVALAAGGTATLVVSANVAALTEGVLTTMLLSKLKTTTVVVLVCASLASGAGALRPRTGVDQQLGEKLPVHVATQPRDKERGLMPPIIHETQDEDRRMALDDHSGMPPVTPVVPVSMPAAADDIVKTADPKPLLTQLVRTVLTEMANGDKTSPRMTPGMRQLVAEADVPPTIASWLKDLKEFTFLADHNAPAPGIDRRGAKVSRIVYYKMVIGEATQFLEVYLTAETPHKVADIAPYRPCQLSQQLRGRN